MDTGPHCQSRSSSDSGSLRILVVEDEPDTADSLAALLALWGYAAEVAADGPTALQTALAHAPDVVLLDLGLPGLDGWAVAKRLREQVTPKRPFLLAISGYGQPADQRRSAEAGVDVHWLKPVDLRALHALLTRFQTLRYGPAGGTDPFATTPSGADSGTAACLSG